jgi:hypothetical protein
MGRIYLKSSGQAGRYCFDICMDLGLDKAAVMKFAHDAVCKCFKSTNDIIIMGCSA